MVDGGSCVHVAVEGSLGTPSEDNILSKLRAWGDPQLEETDSFLHFHQQLSSAWRSHTGLCPVWGRLAGRREPPQGYTVLGFPVLKSVMFKRSTTFWLAFKVALTSRLLVWVSQN